MSIESGDRPPIHPKIKEMVDSGFSNGRKLYGDRFNVWYLAWHCYNPKDTQKLEPLPHYQQSMEEATFSNGEHRYSPEGIEYVMQLSDAEAVAAFDQLVDEYNADLERIKTEQDFAAAHEFARRAKELIYKKG